jgi:ribonuclease VapC
MIVVDSSAVLAIVLREPEQQAFEEIIARSDRCVISAVNAHETATVLRLRHGPAAVARLWRWLAESELEVVSFDEAQVHAAAAAFNAYGKGIHPKARLNLSDCAAYALAKSLDAPLLFKGNDFTQAELKRCT